MVIRNRFLLMRGYKKIPLFMGVSFGVGKIFKSFMLTKAAFISVKNTVAYILLNSITI